MHPAQATARTLTVAHMHLSSAACHHEPMDSKEAERAAAELLTQHGFAVTKLETQEREKQRKKTADFRAVLHDETWVLDVKGRQLDRVAEKRLDAGEVVEHTARLEDDPNQFFMAFRRFQDGAEQVKATRLPGELGAVWFILNEHVTKAMDPDQLCSTLLGSRRIFAPAPELRTVYAVHEPQFGREVDAVVFQRRSQIAVLLNPWTTPERLARVRTSRLVRCAAGQVKDPRAEIDSGEAWVAPSPEEARELGILYLKTLRTDKSIDVYEGAKRREFQIELALRQMYGPDITVGSFLSEVLHTVRQRLPEIDDRVREPRGKQ